MGTLNSYGATGHPRQQEGVSHKSPVLAVIVGRDTDWRLPNRRQTYESIEGMKRTMAELSAGVVSLRRPTF